jgi:hypothetical protein
MLLEGGSLAPGLNKNLLETNPKFALHLHTQANTTFDMHIKGRHNSAQDPEKHEDWIQEVEAKTKLVSPVQRTHSEIVCRKTQRN